MRFWKIDAPNYENGDYQNMNINGELEHPFGLPGVKCTTCNRVWGGGRILPYTCPPKIRFRKELNDSWPISLAEHKQLQEEITTELKEEGISITELLPGTTFQPCYLDVPSKPEVDFLWSSGKTAVISERIKKALEDFHLTDVYFCKVNLRKIGRRKAKLPPPVPRSGEPEDIISEVPLLSSNEINIIGPYYELIIMNESASPQGYEPIIVCNDCGYYKCPDDIPFIMTDGMWKNADIFYWATSSYIIITDLLKDYLERLAPTNIEFKEITAA